MTTLGPGLLHDLVVPVVTPFIDGRLDDDALARHAGWVVEQGATGVMLFGTTGEGPSIAVGDKLRIARRLVSALPGIPVIGSVTESSTTAALECMRGYNDLALAAVLILPPFYFQQAPPEGIADFLLTVGSTAHHPVLAYHIPSMAPAVPLDLVTGSLLWGVKGSGADPAYAAAAAAAGMAVFVGAEALIAQGISAGALGSIAGLGNLAPGHLAAICRHARDGNRAEAARLLEDVVGLQRAIETVAPGPGFVAAYKALAGSLHGTELGDPLTPLRGGANYFTEAVRDALRRVMNSPAQP